MREQNTSVTRGARALRRELGQVFPGIRFEVTRDRFPGGDAIRVGWRGGPEPAEVRAVAGKYEQRHTAGAADLYVTRETAFTRRAGGAKFVILDHAESDEDQQEEALGPED